jgi:hypothetical protein
MRSVPDLNPYCEQVSRSASPFGVASHCPAHCDACVALGIRSILTCRGPPFHLSSSIAIPLLSSAKPQLALSK